MLDGRYQKGFSNERLNSTREPRVRKDEQGYYIMSLSENSPVHFDDFYKFLELTYERASDARRRLDERMAETGDLFEDSAT